MVAAYSAEAQVNCGTDLGLNSLVMMHGAMIVRAMKLNYSRLADEWHEHFGFTDYPDPNTAIKASDEHSFECSPCLELQLSVAHALGKDGRAHTVLLFEVAIQGGITPEARFPPRCRNFEGGVFD